MNRPPEMARLDFVRSRLNSARMDIEAVYGKPEFKGEQDILTAFHDAIEELTAEVATLRSLLSSHLS